jgi:hypothetical protein
MFATPIIRAAVANNLAAVLAIRFPFPMSSVLSECAA